MRSAPLTTNLGGRNPEDIRKKSVPVPDSRALVSLGPEEKKTYSAAGMRENTTRFSNALNLHSEPVTKRVAMRE